MEFHLVDIIQHIVNIIVLFIILRSLVYKPVLGFIRKRNEGIRAEQAEIERRQGELDALSKEAASVLEQSNEKAEQTVVASITRAQEAADELMAHAQEQIQEMKTKAETDISELENTRREQMDKEVREQAMQLASELLKRELRAEDNEAVIARFFQKAKS